MRQLLIITNKTSYLICEWFADLYFTGKLNLFSYFFVENRAWSQVYPLKCQSVGNCLPHVIHTVLPQEKFPQKILHFLLLLLPALLHSFLP